MVESVQAKTSSMGTFNTSLQLCNNWANKSAPQSSKRGMVCLLIGATLVFHITKDVYELPFGSSILRYTTQEYAFSEASENPWS